MAQLEFTIKFDAIQFKKLLKIAEENIFIVMKDDFSELETVLNINDISNTDDLIEQ